MLDGTDPYEDGRYAAAVIKALVELATAQGALIEVQRSGLDAKHRMLERQLVDVKAKYGTAIRDGRSWLRGVY